MSIRTPLAAFVATLIAAPTFAGFASLDDLCKRGDTSVCEDAARENRILATELFGPSGSLDWEPAESILDEITPHNFRGRTARRAQEICTVVARTWVSVDVAQYARSNSLVAVDRSKYNRCFAEELPRAKEAELKRMVLKSLVNAAAIFAPVFALLMLWYRRPLGRWLGRVSGRMKKIGAD